MMHAQSSDNVAPGTGVMLIGVGTTECALLYAGPVKSMPRVMDMPPDLQARIVVLLHPNDFASLTRFMEEHPRASTKPSKP